MSQGTSKGVFLGLALLVANGWAQYLLWFGGQGLVRWRQTEKELITVRSEVNEVEGRIQELKEEIRLLEKDPAAVEGVARRDLGLVYPDEIIFIVPNGFNH
ncbi:MAG: septum formation initiator family protein [Magnetococcales bacterium]|nr:septum formation initiator family protein [Magnetococcales bacterium]